MPEIWRYLDDNHPNVSVYYRSDLGTKWGETIWDETGRPTIYLAVDLGPIQTRCTLAHEIMHVEHGAPCRDECPDNEAEVAEATARWLIPDLAVLANHLREKDVRDTARLLRVTRPVLADRLATFTTDELREMQQHLSSGEEAVLTGRSAACGRRWWEVRRVAPPARHACR